MRSSPEYLTIAEDLGFASITPIPISARYGDNIFAAL
jgi:bifunctional enzyme CysN/CysC